MKLNNITIGTDPELFLFDTSTEKFRSAIEIVPGTKEMPWHPNELPNGFALQTDNVLVEFNVPAVNFEDEHTFIENILRMKNFIREFVKQYDTNLTIICQAAAMLPQEELNHPAALEFGCDPDFNCYTGKQNKRPEIKNPFLRSAGFHWHIGYQDSNLKDSIDLIRYMDLFMGVPSVLFDNDVRRRKLYGKAGAFRLQPYGVEWRVLSSYFLDRADLIAMMYRQLEKAIRAFEDNMPLPEPHVVRTAINHSDVELAKQLIEVYKLIEL